MSLVKGFSDKVYINDGNTWKELATIGDVTYGKSRADIAVKTRASDKVRSIPGMESCPISFQVIAGTDPKDTNAVDAFAILMSMYESGTARRFCFGGTPSGSGSSPVGGVTDTFVCLSFNTNAPLDDLKTADVSLALSGLASASGS